MPKKVLFISGSVGLGHVTRDFAIAKELRKQNPEIEVSWLASPPASKLLADAGETLLPEVDRWGNDNIPLEDNTKEGFRINLMKYVMAAGGEFGRPDKNCALGCMKVVIASEKE